jgi:hypothetical protein
MLDALRRIEAARRRRIVLCPPDTEDRLRAVVAFYGLSDLLTVRASEHVPEGAAYILDAPEGD